MNNRAMNALDLLGRCVCVLLGGVLIVGIPAKAGADGGKQQKKKQAQQAPHPVAPPPPHSALLTHEAWQSAPRTPLAPGELDAIIAKELQNDKIEPAALTTDEQFIRRVTLDLTGRLPEPADVEDFVKNRSSDKRAQLIDRLLGSEKYARHWAHYWREVLTARINDRRGLALSRPFDEWLFKQFSTNQSWDKIVRQMLTAEGSCRFDDAGSNGALFFLLSHMGPDAANEQAAEASRIFLGIQIQCAQCHDHPSDQWKRVQFHELAGYFARVREKPMREEGKPVGIELISLAKGEHEMASREDPKKIFITPPRFLDGKSPGRELPDLQRRRSLASAIVDKENYWFAGAYVNRIWGELMGQSFYEPVDDMGPGKQAVFPEVLTRLTGAFRGSNYDIPQMFRTIMNSETYQRQIRLGESNEQHLHFAAAYPTRLHADALWESLVNALGNLGIPPAVRLKLKGPLYGVGLESQFKQEFEFDPSLKADEVEGSIAQALMLMNNPTINQRLKAEGTNLLGRILKSYPTDDQALRILYLRTLARKPTDAEAQRCREYIEKAGNRTEGFEDILWALINSTEFQTKR
jgi:hypothetical protein